jgi:RNA polymerase sigma-70 factor (ECF subfamily)
MLLDKIAELGEPDSTIIMQKYYYGRSAKEIAAMTSLTPENIRVRSGRAVRKLREMLEEAGISL